MQLPMLPMQLPRLLSGISCCLRMIVSEALRGAWSTGLLPMRLLFPITSQMLAVSLQMIKLALPALGCKGQMTVSEVLCVGGPSTLVLIGASPSASCFGHLGKALGLFWAV